MSRRDRWVVAGILGLVLLASVSGARRGLPCWYSYHQDAVAPLRALGFLSRYFDPVESTDKYPTFAYLYFGTAARIALALRGDDQARALLELAEERGPDAWPRQIDPDLWSDMAPYEAAISDCIVAGRIASALANVLLALAAALLAAAWFGAAAGPLAATLVGFHPYDVYYAHTMNVDAPCLAFAMLALALVSRWWTKGGRRWAVWAGVFAALSAATKDPIAAWLAFVPVALLLLRRRPGSAVVGADFVRASALATLSFLATYAIAANWVFDLDGFVRHARFGLSEGVREQYDMVAELRADRPLTAWLYLTIYVGTYLYRSAGAAGFVLSVAGIAFALRRHRAAACLLLLPAAGYLLVFVMRMGLAYPRHLLPVYLPAMILGAGAAAFVLGAPPSRRGAPLKLACALLVLLVAWRGVTVNRLWSDDPRARAAAWLQETLPAGTVVVAHTNHATPPPRIPPSCRARWVSSRDLVQALKELDPEVRVFVRSTNLKPVVRAQHPDPDELRERTPHLIRMFERRVYHPILEDIDAAPVVVIAGRGG